MQIEFTQKMKGLCEKIANDIIEVFKDDAVEAHLLGSIARGTNDALSDIDIWFTFEDSDISRVLEERFDRYKTIGEIVLLGEMQHSFPLDGIHTGVLYKIDGELIRVDYYLCPFSSSRVMPDAKILFETKKVESGEMIPETKRIQKDPAEKMSGRITFLISMCFIGIKKIVRGDEAFIPFLTGEFQKSENDIPVLKGLPTESNFDTLRKALEALGTVSNSEQKNAIVEIRQFLDRVEANA